MEFRLTHSTDVELIAVPYRLAIAGSAVSISKEQSNELLYRLRDRGFTTLYGELLRATEEQLSFIPSRPEIQNTGCEVVKKTDNPEWLLLWEVHKPGIWAGSDRIDRSIGSMVDAVHLVSNEIAPSLDRQSIANLFDVPITDCSEGLWEQEWNVEDLEKRQFLQHKRGKLLNNAAGRHELREQLEIGAMQTDLAAGIELELYVAEALHDAGLWFRSGTETPFGELDVLVAILDSLVLIECKNTKSIGVRDIQVLVSRAASVGADYAFLFTTMSSNDLHSNVREALKQFRRSGPVYVMVLFIRDLEEHIRFWISEISSIIGFAMIDHWIMAEESYTRRSPLWKIDSDGRINGFDRPALSEFITTKLLTS